MSNSIFEHQDFWKGEPVCVKNTIDGKILPIEDGDECLMTAQFMILDFSQNNMKIEGNLNKLIKTLIEDKLIDTNKISDGYHCFGELYEHRIVLFITICQALCNNNQSERVWKSIYHSDGTKFDGWFIIGIDYAPGEQITYHLPIKYWDKTSFVKAIDKAPEWDNHTSEEVIERLSTLKI